MSKVNIIKPAEQHNPSFESLDYRIIFLDEEGDILVKQDPDNHEGRDILRLFQADGTPSFESFTSYHIGVPTVVAIIDPSNISIKIG